MFRLFTESTVTTSSPPQPNILYNTLIWRSFNDIRAEAPKTLRLFKLAAAVTIIVSGFFFFVGMQMFLKGELAKGYIYMVSSAVICTLAYDIHKISKEAISYMIRPEIEELNYIKLCKNLLEMTILLKELA